MKKSNTESMIYIKINVKLFIHGINKLSSKPIQLENKKMFVILK